MDPQESQPKNYLALLWRGKWLILLTGLVAVAAVVAFGGEQTPAQPTYQATATIMVENASSAAGDGLNGLSELNGSGDRGLNTQIQLMESRSVMERAIQKLREGETLEGEEPRPITSQEIEALRAAITVQPIEGTDLLEVRAKSVSPEYAERRANAVVEAFIDYNKAERIRNVEEALAKVTEQIKSTEQAAELAARASVVLPRLSAELDALARDIERSSRDIASFQAELTALDTQTPLERNAPAIEKLALAMDALSQDFAATLVKLKRIESEQGAEEPKLHGKFLVVQQRVEEGADNLWVTLESVTAKPHLLNTVQQADIADQAYKDIAAVALSLDVASRQMSGLLIGGVEPLIQGELNALGGRMTSALNEVRELSAVMETIANNGGVEVSPVVVKLSAAQQRLDAAAQSLKNASVAYASLAGEPTDGELLDVVNKVREGTDIGNALLSQTAGSLNGIELSSSDPVSYGEMVVVEARVQDASNRAAAISAQLQDLQAGRGPGYQDLLKLQQELEVSRLNPQSIGITLVDSAVMPQITGSSRSSFFNNQTRIPLGAVGGMLLGALAVFLKDQMDQTVRTQRQIRNQAGLTPLGVIPKKKAYRKGHLPIVSPNGATPFSEALNLIGTALEGPLSQGIRSLIISSPSAQEGKTMLAVNLAQVISHYGHRALLVDANLRKPEVAKALDLGEVKGLSTALTNRQNPFDYVIKQGGFWVIPGGEVPVNPVELLSSPEMRTFLQEAQRDYDVVLVDGPPLVGFAETKTMVKELDGVVLVVKAGATSLNSLNESKEELEVAGVRLVGVALNCAPATECSHLKHERYGANPGARKNSAARKDSLSLGRSPSRRKVKDKALAAVNGVAPTGDKLGLRSESD